jgi:hypothetical protein
MKYSMQDFPQASYSFNHLTGEISLTWINFQLDKSNVLAILNATTNTIIMEVDMSSKSISSIDANNKITLVFDTSSMTDTDDLIFTFDFAERRTLGKDLWFFKNLSSLQDIIPIWVPWLKCWIIEENSIYFWDTIDGWKNSFIKIDSQIVLYVRSLFEYLKNPERIDSSWNVRIAWAVTVTGTITTVTTVTWITNIWWIPWGYYFDNINDTARATLIRPLLT